MVPALLLALLTGFVIVVPLESYKILGLFPHPGKSHVDVFLPLMAGLAEKGHNVTVISPFALKNPIPNYRNLILNESSIFVDVINMEEISSNGRLNLYMWVLFALSQYAKEACETGLRSNVVHDLLKGKDDFDLIIIEFFNSDCFLSLNHKFKAPVIGISSCVLMPWTSQRVANPTHTGYIPNMLLDHSDRMTFLERVENTAIQLVHEFFMPLLFAVKTKESWGKYLGKKKSELEDLIGNTSLVLVNTHFSLNLPRPLVPNVVEVGGLHIGKVKPLPQVRILITLLDNDIVSLCDRDIISLRVYRFGYATTRERVS
ncbi:hypothetical protein NQ317_015001 [Molorchus minor]|uniref:Uncharacterized protein n=1 Tax=Molorchus minor TaxID=1323400 RepID=A0ABQ9K7G0_9CUCU|nr:hypothetical protein NQ317_015001 [Molorchus minor]